jgi:AbrB family looped-hinge helix DNA binding protein
MLSLKRRVGQSGRSLEVTIPKEIAEYLRVKLGDYVEFTIEGGKVRLAKSNR